MLRCHVADVLLCSCSAEEHMKNPSDNSDAVSSPQEDFRARTLEKQADNRAAAAVLCQLLACDWMSGEEEEEEERVKRRKRRG